MSVVVDAVEDQQDQFDDELQGGGFHQNEKNGHKVSSVCAVRSRPTIGLPDTIRHKSGRERGLNDGGGIENDDKASKTGVKDCASRLLTWVKTADGVSGN